MEKRNKPRKVKGYLLGYQVSSVWDPRIVRPRTTHCRKTLKPG